MSTERDRWMKGWIYYLDVMCPLPSPPQTLPGTAGHCFLRLYDEQQKQTLVLLGARSYSFPRSKISSCPDLFSPTSLYFFTFGTLNRGHHHSLTYHYTMYVGRSSVEHHQAMGRMDVRKHFYTPAEKKLNERSRAEAKSLAAYNELVLILWYSAAAIVTVKKYSQFPLF